MPTMVHLADEKEAASIKRNGIKVGKYRKGVYCMPVLPDFYISHQWLRELKRHGAKTYIGVYFKIDSKTKVFAGKYQGGHKHIELGQAIKEIQTLENPLGYEIIIDRKIGAKEIEKIKYLPQTIGWRYSPASKGTRPCGCEFCIKGDIKASRIRERLSTAETTPSYVELLANLKTEKDVNTIEDLLWQVKSKTRRSDPEALLFLLEKNVAAISRVLAIVLARFRHKNTRAILEQLLKHEDRDTRYNAASGLLELYGAGAAAKLSSFNDDGIAEALNEWNGAQ